MDEYCGTIIKTNTGIERNQMSTQEPEVVEPEEPEVDANPEDGDEDEEEKSELGQ